MMPFHPAAELFPLVEGVEFDQLVADLKTHGLREKIWTYQGRIIDGRNRERGCRKAGIAPQYREWDGQGSLIEFVLSLNFHRRQLTAAQRVMIAAKAMGMMEEEAKARQQASQAKPGAQVGKVVAGLPPPTKRGENAGFRSASAFRGKARDQAAKAAGVSGRSVQNGKKVLDKAIPEVVKAVEDGKLGVETAAKFADLSPDEQIDALQKVEQKVCENQDRIAKASDLLRKSLAAWREVEGGKDVVRHLEAAGRASKHLQS